MTIQVNKTKQKRKNLFMTDEEAMTLWNHLKQHRGKKWQCLFGLCLWRGLRINEACAVNIRDFRDENFSKLNVILSKSYIVDNFPLLEGFNDLLKEYVAENMHRFKDGYLFPYYNKPENKHINAKTAGTVFCDIRKEIGEYCPSFLDKVGSYSDGNHKHYRYRISTHTMRRWFITKLFEAGLDWHEIDDIQRYQKKGTCYTYYDSYRTWKEEENHLQNAFGDLWDGFNDVLPGQMKLEAWQEV